MKATRGRARGFTLVELLISLTITAILMASAAAAMHASLQGYSENEKLAAVTQTARSVLGRLAREVRTADNVACTSSSVTITPPANDDGVTEIRYQYSGGQLRYTVVADQTTEYLLIASSDEVGVSGFAVGAINGVDWQGASCVKSVTVRLALTCGGRTYSVANSAAPRRNQIY